MFAHDLHVALAWTTGLALAVVTVEGGVRAVRGSPADRLARAALNVAVVLVGMTAAAGLAMLVRAERPGEWLHLVYALLAFGMVPATDSITVAAGTRAQGLARLAGGLVAIAVVSRLFATG